MLLDQYALLSHISTTTNTHTESNALVSDVSFVHEALRICGVSEFKDVPPLAVANGWGILCTFAIFANTNTQHKLSNKKIMSRTETTNEVRCIKHIRNISKNKQKTRTIVAQKE